MTWVKFCVPGPRLVQRYLELAGSAPGPALLCGPVAYLPPPPKGGYQLDALDRLGRPHPTRPVPPETGTLPSGDHALFWSLSFAVRASPVPPDRGPARAAPARHPAQRVGLPPALGLVANGQVVA